MRRGRLSSHKKVEAVVLLAMDLDKVFRRLGVAGAALSGSREMFLAAGRFGFRTGHEDDGDEEIRRLEARIGEITMDTTSS